MPSDLSIQFLPLLPVWAIALFTLALLALLVQGSRMLLRKDVPRRWVVLLAVLRVAALVVFVLMLLRPVLSYTQTAARPPEILVLIDTSRSMGLPGISGSESRLNEVLPSLQAGDLGNTLRRRFQLHWFAFDRTASPLEEADLADLVAEGPTTCYAESLTSAWDQLRAGGAVPRRLLLVSDGHDLGSGDIVETARRFGLVVDTLAPVAEATAPEANRIVIADVQCARRVLLGSETHFRVTLRSPTPQNNARPLTLRLTEDGKEVWNASVSFGMGRTEQHVRVAHRPTTVGTKRYEFQVAARDAAPSPYQLSVQVVDGKNEILILEDTWRWEFKFLRRLLEDDPSFQFTALLSRTGGAFVQFGTPGRRVQLGGFPQGKAEVEGFDLFILGDVNPKRWPRGLAAAIARLVREEGKGLVFVAGPNLAHLVEVPELHTLLPVELTPASANPLTGPIDVRVSSDGAGSPFFFQPSAAVAQLPALDQVYPPLRKRPAATVLLEATRQANDYGNIIVVAEHTVGRGRVLFVGTDTLWKWQTLAPTDATKTTPYSTFWQQSLRSLTPQRPGLGGARLWLEPDRSRYEVGRRVVVRAEVEADQPLPRPRVQATVVLPDDRRLPLAFASDPNEPNHFRAEFEAPLPGPHRILATVTSEGRTAAESATMIDVEEARSELAATGIDHANLARIAAGTGGHVIDLNNADSWPTADEQPAEMETRTRRLDLWNNFSLLVLLCLLLGSDWLLRLVRGYV